MRSPKRLITARVCRNLYVKIRADIGHITPSQGATCPGAREEAGQQGAMHAVTVPGLPLESTTQ